MSFLSAGVAAVYAQLAPEAGSNVATITDRTGAVTRTVSGTAHVSILAERPNDAPDLQFSAISEPRLLASILKSDLAAEMKSGDIITIPAGDSTVTYRVDMQLLPRNSPRSIVVPVQKL